MMKNVFHKETQFELFPDSAVQETRPEQPVNFFSRVLAVPLETMVVAGLIAVLAVVTAFAFGIARGRRVKTEDPAAVSLRETASAAQTQAAGVPSPESVSAGGKLQAGEPVLPLKASGSQDDIPAPAPPEKSVDKTGAAGTIHTVQVASFKQIGMAQREAEVLKKQGHDAFTAQKGSYYIVCVGRFSDSRQANETMRLLRRRYSDCYVRRL